MSTLRRPWGAMQLKAILLRGHSRVVESTGGVLNGRGKDR